MQGAFENVVCGIDLSPQSRVAVSQARAIADEAAALTAVAVVDIGEAVFGGIHAAEVATALREEAATALKQVSAEDPETRTLLVDGAPVPALIHQAELAKADLVAVGAHGGSRAAGILLGGVATGLAHHAPCPVLIARQLDSDSFPERILCATDGSTYARAATETAAGIAAKTGAALIVLRVSDSGQPGEEARDEIHAITEPHGITPRLQFLRGSAEREIVRAANGFDADLIVIGSRGLTGIAALGSVSEKVAHRAECSVLIVRPRSGGPGDG